MSKTIRGADFTVNTNDVDRWLVKSTGTTDFLTHGISNFTFQDPIDNTKEILFDVSGVSAATTRTITIPDADGTMATEENFMSTGITDNATVNVITIDSSERFLTGIVVPDLVGAEAGSMTISTGNSGVTSPNTNADDLLIEGNASAGITIATPNNEIGSIRFADPEDNDVGRIFYDHSVKKMSFVVEDVLGLTIDSSQRILTGTTVPDAVGAEAGSMTISTGDSVVTTFGVGADDFIIETDAGAGMTIATPSDSIGTINFADPENPDSGKIAYSHDTNAMTFKTLVTTAMTMDSTQRILTGTTVPDAVGAEAGSMTISTGNSTITTADTTADDLLIEGSGAAGISILTPNTVAGSIMFGDPEDPNIGQIVYDHNGDANTMTFIAGAQVEMDLTTAGMQLSTGARVDRILDEDNMATDSATALATQQSIKAYADLMLPLAGGTLSGALISTLNNGTVGTGTTAVENGDGFHHTTVLTMAGVFPAITGDTAQSVGLLIYTFPAGVIVVDAMHMDVGITQSDGFINNDTPDVGIGRDIGTGAIATLDLGTFLEDYVTGSAAANCTGTLTDLSEITGSGIRLIEDGGNKTVHFNAADLWDDTAGGDALAAISGTVTITWRFLGA